MPRELIYKDDARKAILQTNSTFAYCIHNIKPVDAVEVVHAEWGCVNEEANVWMCTGNDGCGNELILLESTPKGNGWDYCPYCGAKMDGGNEDGNS